MKILQYIRIFNAKVLRLPFVCLKNLERSNLLNLWKARKTDKGDALSVSTRPVVQNRKQKPVTRARNAMLAYT